VVAIAREILAVTEQRQHRPPMESSNIKNLNKVEDKENYRVKFSNRFAVLKT
jgi:hypothetical protein